MFFKAKLGSLDCSFFCFSRFGRSGKEIFSIYKDHSGLASELYLSSDKRFLIKLERDKYKANRDLLRWFFRDFVRRVFIFGSDAKREFKGYKIARLAGLNTPKLYSWGVSLSLFNEFSAFIMVENKIKATPGLSYFRSLSKDDKVDFLIRLANEAVTLAKYGYVHRDFHLNNFLIDDDGRVLWIDNHFRKLSKFKKKRWKQLVDSLSDSKLDGEESKNIVLSVFKREFR